MSTAVTVTVPVLCVCSGSMISTDPLTVKSVVSVPDPGEAVTMIVVVALDAWSRVAVTVLVTLFSEISNPGSAPA